MASKKKKKKKKRLMWLFIFVLISGFFLREEYMMYKLKNVKSEYAQHLANEKAVQQKLKNQIKQSQRSEYVENQARTKLGLLKPDEILFIDQNKKK